MGNLDRGLKTTLLGDFVALASSCGIIASLLKPNPSALLFSIAGFGLGYGIRQIGKNEMASTQPGAYKPGVGIQLNF